MLVSEVMLQQTPVARVEPVWRDWMARWPTPAALAAVSPAEVIRAWGKLGYPRRALRLREAALAVVYRHGGMVPDDVARRSRHCRASATYTARAVACFGYGQPAARRRHQRAAGRGPAGARAGRGRQRPGGRPHRHRRPDPARPGPSGPVLRRGHGARCARLCRPGTPRCGACPVRDRCAWVRAGSPPHDGPPRRVQKFPGTDRQVRGRLLDVLRAATAPVPPEELEAAWDDAVQRSRCLDSLLVDGLVEQTDDGRFTPSPRLIITSGSPGRQRRRGRLRSRKVISHPARPPSAPRP